MIMPSKHCVPEERGNGSAILSLPLYLTKGFGHVLNKHLLKEMLFSNIVIM